MALRSPKVTQLCECRHQVQCFLLHQAVSHATFSFSKWLQITMFCLLLTEEKTKIFKNKTKSQFLVEYSSLSGCVRTCGVRGLEPVQAPASLVPGYTLIKVIRGFISLSYLAFTCVYWLWLLPEPMETTLAKITQGTF